MTEGETDLIHIKAALKNKYKEYENLIEKKDNSFAFNSFAFKVSFFNMSRRNSWFFAIGDGGNKYGKICGYYGLNNKKPEESNQKTY